MGNGKFLHVYSMVLGFPLEKFNEFHAYCRFLALHGYPKLLGWSYKKFTVTKGLSHGIGGGRVKLE